MAESTPIINSFVAGELSPKLAGRTDITQYYQSAAELENVIVEFYGGARKAPGTYFVSEVKTSSKETRLIPFVFSDTQAYIIEVGDQYMRFYMDNGQILAGATAYELTTPYLEADIWDIQFAQKADVLYLTHPDYEQRKVTRTAHNSWSISIIDYSTGEARPALMDENITATTISPSAATGAGITLTATDNIFHEDHVGSIWEVHASSFGTGYVKITSVATGGLKSTAIGNVLYSGNIGGTGAYTTWSEAAWSNYRGFPRCVTFHEQRLIYGYTQSQPNTVWGSQVLAFETFELGSEDDKAFSFTLATNQVEVIRQIFPLEEILIGTPNGIHSLGSGSSVAPITPSNVVVKKKTNYGSSFILPVAIGGNAYYWQNYNKILREYSINADTLEYDTKDATVISEHITESGIVDMAYQQSPVNILWCVRADGKLVSFTRQIEQKVSAWAKHETDGYYESVAVIPNDTGGYDEVWFIVKRYIDGSWVRYVEYMVAPTFEDQEDAFFVHSGLVMDNPKDITGATAADPVVITSASHSLGAGTIVKIRNVVGMTELNYKKFKVASPTVDTFELTDLDDNDIDGSAYTAYVSGGEIRECKNSVSGLDHLEGKTVQVLADGASHPDRSVSSGAITLDGYYSQVVAGLGYTARIKTNDLEGAPGKAVSQGKRKRVFGMNINFFETVGCRYGTEDKMESLIFRTSAMATDQAIPLFTGIKSVPFPGGWEKAQHIIIEQEQPLPMYVLSIVPEMEVSY